MKPWLHKIEVIVDKIIPYLVLILLILIIGEFTHYTLILENEDIVLLIDYIIVIFFVIDLCFKYYRVKDFKVFLKKYWLEIIAVFPFFLIFRLVEEIIIIFRFGQELGESQTIVHTIVEINRISREASEEARILREIQEATRLERTSLLVRLIRPIERIPRIITSFHFYEKPYKKIK